MSESSAIWEARLAAAGVALAAGDTPADAAAGPPWYVRLMAGIGGFIGGVMVLLFLGVGLASLKLFDSAGVAGAVGLLLCAAAVSLYRIGAGSAASEQCGLAMSIAGQIAVAFALMDVDLFGSPGAQSWWGLIGLQAVLLGLIGNGLHRTLTAAALVLFGALSCRAPMLLALWWGAVALAATAVMAAESRLMVMQQGDAVSPLAFGLCAGLLASQLPWFFLLWSGNVGGGPAALPWATQLPALLLAAWLAATRATTPMRGCALLTAFAAGLLGAWLPGWIAALLLAVLGLGWARPAWAVVAGLALVFAVSRYYYSLAITLLEKSAWMAAAGVGCIMLAALVRATGPRILGVSANTEGMQ